MSEKLSGGTNSDVRWVRICAQHKSMWSQMCTRKLQKAPGFHSIWAKLYFKRNSITILLFFQEVLVTQHNSYLHFRVEPRIERRIDNSASALKCMCRSVEADKPGVDLGTWVEKQVIWTYIENSWFYCKCLILNFSKMKSLKNSS